MNARALLAVALLVSAIPAGVRATVAASLVLTDAEKRQALAYGHKSVHEDRFDAEWRVSNAAGDTASVLTPFHRLVIAARHAAFRGETLRPGEPDRLLRRQKDRIVFLVQLRGRHEDFARLMAAELIAGDRQLKPAFAQNDRTPARQEDGTYVARCTYTFPVKELMGRSRVSLVLRDADGREASRFAIDLAAMK